jgi:hypothetical protein
MIFATQILPLHNSNQKLVQHFYILNNFTTKLHVQPLTLILTSLVSYYQVPSSRPRRTRTTSENFYAAGSTGPMSTGRFHATPVTPVKGPRGTMMPRNSSAPHFVDTRHVMPRITSTPGFGRLTRLNSNEPNGLGSQDHVCTI